MHTFLLAVVGSLSVARSFKSKNLHLPHILQSQLFRFILGAIIPIRVRPCAPLEKGE